MQASRIPSPSPLMAPSIYSLAIDSQNRLFIADFGNNRIVVLNQPYTQTTPSLVINKGTKQPYSLAFDSKCNLWVTKAFDSIDEYIPPYNSTPHKTLSNLKGAETVAFDDKDDLFVGLVPQGSTSSVIELPPPYNGKPIARITQGVDGPLGLAVDVHEDLFVCNYYNSTITQYTPPYSSPPLRTISAKLSLPTQMAFGPI